MDISHDERVKARARLLEEILSSGMTIKAFPTRLPVMRSMQLVGKVMLVTELDTGTKRWYGTTRSGLEFVVCKPKSY